MTLVSSQPPLPLPPRSPVSLQSTPDTTFSSSSPVILPPAQQERSGVNVIDASAKNVDLDNLFSRYFDAHDSKNGAEIGRLETKIKDAINKLDADARSTALALLNSVKLEKQTEKVFNMFNEKALIYSQSLTEQVKMLKNSSDNKDVLGKQYAKTLLDKFNKNTSDKSSITLADKEFVDASAEVVCGKDYASYMPDYYTALQITKVPVKGEVSDNGATLKGYENKIAQVNAAGFQELLNNLELDSKLNPKDKETYIAMLCDRLQDTTFLQDKSQEDFSFLIDLIENDERPFNAGDSYLKEQYAEGDGRCFEHALRLPGFCDERGTDSVAPRKLWVKELVQSIDDGDEDTINWMSQELKSNVKGAYDDFYSIPASLKGLVTDLRAQLQNATDLQEACIRELGDLYRGASITDEFLGDLRAQGKNNVEIFDDVRAALVSHATLKTAEEICKNYNNSVLQIEQFLDGFCKNIDYLKAYINGYYGMEDPKKSGYVLANREDGLPHWMAKKHRCIIVVLATKGDYTREVTSVFNPLKLEIKDENINCISHRGAHFSAVELNGADICSQVNKFNTDGSSDELLFSPLKVYTNRLNK